MPQNLRRPPASDKTLGGYLKAHLGRIKAGDYFAVLGYIQMNAEHEQALANAAACGARQEARRDLPGIWSAISALDRTGVQGRSELPECSCRSPATTRWNLPVPGQKYTFGIVKAAQARGDFQVLAERGRRALRVHLGQQLESRVWQRCKPPYRRLSVAS